MIKRMTLGLLLLLAVFPAFSKTQVLTLDLPQVLRHAKQLPSQGVVQKQGNYIYLKVSNQYLLKLYPQLLAGLKNQRCVKMSRDSVGAHMTIIDHRSLDREAMQSVNALLNKTFDFRVTKIYKVTFHFERHQHRYTRAYYVVKVVAPALMQALKQQGLTRYLSDVGHLHITIAEKKMLGDVCER
jgi:hypothetical protein